MTGTTKTKLTGFVMTVVVGLGGLSPSFAAQKRTMQQVKPNTFRKIVTCSVSASQLPNGQKPTANGGNVAYGGGPKNWVRVKVHRLPKPNTPYTVRLQITNGSLKQHDISTQLGLPQGSSKNFGPFKANLPSTTNKLSARVFISNGTSKVRRHPACQLAWTAQVVH